MLTGVQHIARIIRAGQPVSPEERRRLTGAEQDGRPPAWLIIPFLGLFVAFGALAFGIGLRTRTVIPATLGAIFGGVPLLISLVLLFTPSALISLPLAVGMTVVGYRKGRSQYWHETLRHSRGSGTQDEAWVTGSDGTNSNGSSDAGSNSDSYGGGSSGGGGASGSW